MIYEFTCWMYNGEQIDVRMPVYSHEAAERMAERILEHGITGMSVRHVV